MQNSLELQIRERAYHLWLDSGCDGDANAHWLAAERDMLSAAAPARPAVVKAAAKKKAPVRKSAKAA